MTKRMRFSIFLLACMFAGLFLTTGIERMLEMNRLLLETGAQSGDQFAEAFTSNDLYLKKTLIAWFAFSLSFLFFGAGVSQLIAYYIGESVSSSQEES